MDKLTILKDYFGYDGLKKEQEEIIDTILEGRDAIGLLPTGYGKSLTFQIPALLFSGLTIVICPLISLMQDQVEALKDKYIKAEFINSTQDRAMQENIYKRVLAGNVKILYLAAERLLTNRLLEVALGVEVSLIVCDEAHTLLWSEDFRFALGRINEFINRLPNRPPVLALTATATNNTIERIEELLELKAPRVVIGDCDRKNIFYSIIKSKNKDDDLIKILKADKRKTIIYCLTIKSCEHVQELLSKNGINSRAYHGRLVNKSKAIIQNDFTRGRLNIIICTNAFGMGVDIPDIRLVIEYDMPASIEDFSQQTGRASRDGKYAEAILLFNLDDIKTIEYFISSIEENGRGYRVLRRIKNDRLNKMDKMLELCIGRKCIHKYIANYFGIKHNGHCGMCSNCVKVKGSKKGRI